MIHTFMSALDMESNMIMIVLVQLLCPHFCMKEWTTIIDG